MARQGSDMGFLSAGGRASRRGHFIRVAAALAVAATLAAPGAGRAAEAAKPFRLCADPDNLPFSSSAPSKPGFYVELGQEIARSLGRGFETVWSLSYFGKRTVRTTLLANQCDAFIGLPAGEGFMGPQLIFSKPFMTVGYALVVPASQQVARLDDLKGKRVAVQFSTPPQSLIATRDDIGGVTFLNPEEAMRALARGEVAAAFVWGPTAGYMNASEFQDAYRVIPVAGDGMRWPVAIGFAKAQGALRDEVNALLDKDADAIGGLEAKYGFPSAAPITLAGAAAPSPGIVLAGEAQPAASPSPAVVAEPAVATAGIDTAAVGREIFNGTCAHCHGPDAIQSERRINLRLLQHRYGDRMNDVFHETVTKGRAAKGMPSWDGVFTEDDFSKILAYLHTVQGE